MELLTRTLYNFRLVCRTILTRTTLKKYTASSQNQFFLFNNKNGDEIFPLKLKIEGKCRRHPQQRDKWHRLTSPHYLYMKQLLLKWQFVLCYFNFYCFHDMITLYLYYCIGKERERNSNVIMVYKWSFKLTWSNSTRVVNWILSLADVYQTAEKNIQIMALIVKAALPHSIKFCTFSSIKKTLPKRIIYFVMRHYRAW